jgi:hypothetical protein
LKRQPRQPLHPQNSTLTNASFRRTWTALMVGLWGVSLVNCRLVVFGCCVDCTLWRVMFRITFSTYIIPSGCGVDFCYM